MEPPVIGVLALQGAFAKHAAVLHSLGARVVEVRKPEDLTQCDGLIIPGGESTTMMKQMRFINFIEPLRLFAEKKPVFGTCAGLILISQKVLADNRIEPFNLIDVDVERNAFGRQVESFHVEVEALLGGKKSIPLLALFIRAPRIRRTGIGVKVLAAYEEEPILVQQGHHLGATFHPELSDCKAVHSYFLQLVSEKLK